MRMLPTLLIAIFSLSAFAAPNRSELKAALQKVMPQNWIVTESTGCLLISNKTEATFYNAVSMNGTDLERDRQARVSQGEKGHFVVKMIVGPFLSQEVYSEIWRALPRRIYHYKPTIPVQEYYALRDDALPDGYGPGYSIYVSTDRHPCCLLWPETANQEWQRVVSLVLSVFERYKDATLVQPNGAANGSQPIRSETNRTSSAAGSRR